MRNIKKELSIGLIAISMSFGWYSCTKELDTKEELNNNQTEVFETQLAKIDLGEKGSVEFFELEPGDLYVESTLSSADFAPKKSNLNPLEIYEFYKNEKAPEVLVEAFNRAKSLAAQNNEKVENALQTNQSVVDQSSRLTAEEFQSSYCSANWDYIFCWTNRTGTTYVKKTSASMHTTANPYRGSVRHILKYKKSGSWHTVRDRIVLENHIHTISSWNWSVDRYREAKVTEASGDGYHHSIRGTN